MSRLSALLLLTTACDNGLEPDVFKRNQPRIDRLFTWDGGTVAEADRYYRIDVDLEKAVPLDIPGLDTIQQLVMRGATPVAMGARQGRRLLKERGASGWADGPVPDCFAKADAPAVLAADESSLVLWGEGICVRRKEGEAWRFFTLPRPAWPLFVDGARPDHAVLMGDLLVVGFDCGEWGGALAMFDLEKGASTLVDDVLPVHQLHLDGKGRVWAVHGLDHLNEGQGILRVFENGAWSIFAQAGSGGRSARNWTLPPMSFEAVDVDSRGNPWLLGDWTGVACWDGKGWSMATKDWPRQTFNGGMYRVPGSGLRLLGEESGLVAMGDAGLALWNWRRGRLRRISLKP